MTRNIFSDVIELTMAMMVKLMSEVVERCRGRVGGDCDAGEIMRVGRQSAGGRW